jgi:hypothetical protein
MFDILTASRLPEAEITVTAEDFRPDSKLFTAALHARAIKALADIPPFHFPIAFPEVFLRDRAGFDVIVGNPPWEEAKVEEDKFWARYVPGFRGLPQHERERITRQLRTTREDLCGVLEKETAVAEVVREVLVTGPYPGMGTGDPDLYKAFCWRFWHLISQGSGRFGVVLPRPVWIAKGSQPFRETVFNEAMTVDVVVLINQKHWVFPGVHEQNPAITLTCITRGNTRGQGRVRLRGPFRSHAQFVAGVGTEPSEFDAKDVLSWTDTASLPLLPAQESAGVLAQLRKAPRLDLRKPQSWRARPYAELHSKNDKPLMRFSENRPRGYWPVFKGETFDIWDPDTGTYYAWCDPDKVSESLDQTRQSGRRKTNSPFLEFADQPGWFADRETLPCKSARIAFRDVTNRTNRRTIIAALVPPKLFLTEKAPYILWPAGDPKDQAFLLGCLCSIPLDWYARRFVETSIKYHLLNSFPVPRPGRDNPLWQRVVQIAGRLACPDGRFAEWAAAVGVECGPIPEPDKEAMIYELDAVVAHLYGLTEAHVRHIFETFHEGWDCQGRLTAVLRFYRHWGERP